MGHAGKLGHLNTIAAVRSAGDDTVTVYANLTAEPAEVQIDGAQVTLDPWGWKLL